VPTPNFTLASQSSLIHPVGFMRLRNRMLSLQSFQRKMAYSNFAFGMLLNLLKG
jgi:hypothetical protein